MHEAALRRFAAASVGGPPAQDHEDGGAPGGARPEDRQVGGDHYKRMAVQPWTALQAWLTPEEFRGYLKGTAIAYLARAGAKGPEREDVEKAAHTLEHLIGQYQAED